MSPYSVWGKKYALVFESQPEFDSQQLHSVGPGAFTTPHSVGPGAFMIPYL